MAARLCLPDVGQRGVMTRLTKAQISQAYTFPYGRLDPSQATPRRFILEPSDARQKKGLRAFSHLSAAATAARCKALVEEGGAFSAIDLRKVSIASHVDERKSSRGAMVECGTKAEADASASIGSSG
jgi:hypothetical protein